MCIYTLLNYHTPCHHLSPTRTYHPPQHCLPVKAALFHYHDQVNQLPRAVPLPMPKICPPVWKRWWEGGNVWVGEVGWRCGVCEEEEEGARDNGGCEGVVGNGNGDVKGMMGEYCCRVWQGQELRQGQGQGERVSTTTMMTMMKKKTKKGGKGRRNNRNDTLLTMPRQQQQQQPPFTSTTTTTATDDDENNNKLATCAVKPPRNGPIIAMSPEVVGGAFHVQGATLAEVPGMLDEAGRQGWKILKMGASVRWEYGQGMVWKDVVF